MRPAYRGLVISILFAACGSFTPDPGIIDVPDTNSGIVIEVNVFAPITTVMSPIPDERKMSGLVDVHVDGEHAPLGTTLTLNGSPVPLSYGDPPGEFDVGLGDLPLVAPGETVTLEVRIGNRSGSFSFPCPPAVEVTTEPNPVVEGAPVTVSWKGNIYYDQPYQEPKLGLCRYVSPSSPVAMICASSSYTTPKAPSTSVTVTAPLYIASDLGYLVELFIPGPLTQRVFSGVVLDRGYCTVVQRTPAPVAP
jgi:hypothetical protein